MSHRCFLGWLGGELQGGPLLGLQGMPPLSQLLFFLTIASVLLQAACIPPIQLPSSGSQVAAHICANSSGHWRPQGRPSVLFTWPPLPPPCLLTTLEDQLHTVLIEILASMWPSREGRCSLIQPDVIRTYHDGEYHLK